MFFLMTTFPQYKVLCVDMLHIHILLFRMRSPLGLGGTQLDIVFVMKVVIAKPQ